MDIVWNDHHRDDWDGLHDEVCGSWQQDWAYGEAVIRRGGAIARARIVEGGRSVALAQFTIRRFGGVIGAALCTRGPVWRPGLSDDAKRAAYRKLKSSAPLARPRFVLFTPDEAAPASGLEGMSRLMTGHSTVLVDLTKPLPTLRGELDGKWRNRLVAAEKAGLAAQPVGVKPAQYQWLLQREDAQRRARGYQALPTGLVEAFQASKSDRHAGLLTLCVRAGKDALAAMMFLIHGRAATYHIGWSGDAGREAGAHNLLLWQGIAALKSRGVERLDLGGLDTEQNAGLARFKLGAGGRVVTLAGTFV